MADSAQQKSRSTSQLWSRRETIKRKIDQLTREYDGITVQLETELRKKPA